MSEHDHELNKRVLEDLAEISDLSKKHEVRNYFYARTEADAKLVARALADRGYGEIEVDDRTMECPEWGWSIQAIVHLLPKEALVDEMTRFANSLAESVGAKYDGWEAKVERR